MEANNIAVCFVGMPVHWDADTIDILGQFFTRRDVIVHGDASKGRSQINQENAVLGVDILEGLQEVTDEWLDGIVGNGNGIERVVDVDTNKGVIQGVHMIVLGEDAMHKDGLGIW